MRAVRGQRSVKQRSVEIRGYNPGVYWGLKGGN